MTTQLALYNNYGKLNDSTAVAYLLGSIIPELKDRLKDKCKQTGLVILDPFPVVWCRLMDILAPQSMDQYKALKDKVLALSPFNYPGQNLQLMMKDFTTMADKLLVPDGQQIVGGQAVQ